MENYTEEIFEKDGISYTLRTHPNGASETFQTGNPPRIVQPPVLTNDQEIAARTAINTEMLVALQEIGGI